MDREEVSVLIRSMNDKQQKKRGMLHICEECPEDHAKSKIELHYESTSLIAVSEDLFSALSKVRRILEASLLQIECNGAARTVFPSAMQQSMGYGRHAYVLRIGVPAQLSDIVDIFECEGNLDFVTLEEQQLFFKKWLSSIRD